MAVTTQYSTQAAKRIAERPLLVDPHDWGGRLRFSRFDFTQATATGDAGSLAYLVWLPAGNVRLILPMSRVAFAAMATGRTMDLGWLAYTDPDGDAVDADPNGLDDGVDVSSAGSVVPGGTIGGDETYLFQSQDGVWLTAQINDGTIAVGKTLKGYFAWVRD